eukprot:10605993-Alexandrium_andersonii.AAC.1
MHGQTQTVTGSHAQSCSHAQPRTAMHMHKQSDMQSRTVTRSRVQSRTATCAQPHAVVHSHTQTDA